MMEVFMEIQRGLPRQGPGHDEATRVALASCKELPERPDVLDIGCGPGQQSLVLAETLGGTVTAVDIHQEYLDELTARSAVAGLTEQIRPKLGDMTDLPFESECFDLIWAEGAAYIMGVGNALQTWKRFLKPGGYVVLSELLWLTEVRPAEAAAFFEQEYPAMGDIEGNIAIFREAGYSVLDHFTIPDQGWWEGYYTPLEAKLPSLREKYQGDEEALGFVEMTAAEIETRRKYGESYGYEFFVARIDGSG